MREKNINTCCQVVGSGKQFRHATPVQVLRAIPTDSTVLDNLKSLELGVSWSETDFTQSHDMGKGFHKATIKDATDALRGFFAHTPKLQDLAYQGYGRAPQDTLLHAISHDPSRLRCLTRFSLSYVNVSDALLLRTLEAFAPTLIRISLSVMGVCDGTWKPIFHAMTQMKLEIVHLAALSLEDLLQPEIGPSVSFANILRERPVSNGTDLRDVLAIIASDGLTDQAARALEYVAPAGDRGFVFVCDPPLDEPGIELGRRRGMDDVKYWMTMIRNQTHADLR